MMKSYVVMVIMQLCSNKVFWLTTKKVQIMQLLAFSGIFGLLNKSFTIALFQRNLSSNGWTLLSNYFYNHCIATHTVRVVLFRNFKSASSKVLTQH